MPKMIGTDVVRDVSRKADAGWLQKAVSFVVTRLSLINREGWPMDQSSSGESVSSGSVFGLSTGWACVNLIAGVQGTLPLEVWRKNPQTGFPEVVPDHWLSRLIGTPNREDTSVDMLERLAISLELRGNAYMRKGRLLSGGSLVSLRSIQPDNVYCFRSAQTNELRYRVRDDAGRIEEVGPEEIWHVRGFGGDATGGLSTLSYGKDAFGLAQAQEKAAATTFKNGVRPSGILSYADWLTDPRKAEARRSLEKYKGAANSGEPIILEGGVKWESLSFSPEEAQMLGARAFSVEEICRFFGVPPVLVGHTEKVSSWGTGIQEITLGWVRFGLRRRLKRIEKSGDQQLLTAQDRADGYFLRYNIEGLLRGDTAGRSAFYEVMTRAGIMTINECRKLEGLPPVPGGDVPRMQSQNIPIGAALQAIPLPAK
jgi:HK97 family phage portal protein